MALRASLVEQLGALEEVCRAAGTPMGSVKAHGAMYEEVAKGGAIYQVLRDAMRGVCAPRTVLVLPSGCAAMATVLRDGVSAREEGFCDRAYRHDGGPGPPDEPGAVLSDPRRRRGRRSAWPGGRWWRSTAILTLWVDTLCIHGDTPARSAMAAAVRRRCEAVPIEVAAPVTA